MRRMRPNFTYANVMATVAFFFAISGAAAVGASTLLTGADIRNGSLTGADVRNRSLGAADLKRDVVTSMLVRNASLTGLDVRDGSLNAADFNAAALEGMRGPKGDTGAQGATGAKGDSGAQGPQGPAGPAGTSDISRLSWSGSDAPGYVDGTPLVSNGVNATGGWLMMGRMDVTNTGGSDDWFNCGVFVDGVQLGGGGDNVPAGATRQVVGVGFGPVDVGDDVTLACFSGGSSTFDVANVSMSLAKLM